MSFALIIDKQVLELLKIDENTPLEISTEDGKSLKICPADGQERRKKLEAALENTNKKFGKTLKNCLNTAMKTPVFFTLPEV